MIAVEIVRKTPDQVGFAVQPRRWVVERFFAWINRNRRLAKDFEATIDGALGLAVVQRLLTAGATCHLPNFDPAELEQFPHTDHPNVQIATGVDLTGLSLEGLFKGRPNALRLTAGTTGTHHQSCGSVVSGVGPAQPRPTT